MHQPYYRNPFSGEAELPWVRLHALKDYWGMARLLREYPGVKLTFNLVPSLLRQLEPLARGESGDSFRDVFRKEAVALTVEETRFLVRNFFSVNFDQCIQPQPRYRELFQKRAAAGNPEWEKVFRPEELRDLQVLFQLSYVDEFYRERDPRIVTLIEKGSRYDEADKLVLLEVESEILVGIVPLYRELAESGQIEISATPFYHPILPLFLDPQEGRRADPTLPPYDLNFCWAADARRETEQALAFMAERFGRRPRGLWPAEGGLSGKVLDLFQELGIAWVAADEISLSRTLALDTAAHPELLYRPYRWKNGQPAIFFRDHRLSDLIGFHYQKVPPREAAADLVRRLKEVRSPLPGGEMPVIPIILDGENAWEFYPQSGRAFLREFYRLLADDPEIHTLCFSDVDVANAPPLERYAPGSWVDGTFNIWIGSEEDRRAWAALAAARNALDNRRSQLSPAAIARVEENLAIASGSDWFWWFGRENFTSELEVFDRLFRENLQQAYRLLDAEIPESLLQPIAVVGSEGVAVSKPLSRLTPRLDGQVSDYFEWQGAGRIVSRIAGGAMNPGQVLADALYYGFDEHHFYLRIDTREDARGLLAEGYRFEIMIRAGDTLQRRWLIRLEQSVPALPDGVMTAIGKIIEVKCRLSALDIAAGNFFELALSGSLQSDGAPPLAALTSFAWARLWVPTTRDYLDSWQV